MANLNVKQLFTNILNKLKANDDKIGDTTMGTTATTITGAIAEHEQDISDLNSNINNLIKHKDVEIKGMLISNQGTGCYYKSDISTRVPSGSAIIGWAEGSNWDERLSIRFNYNNLTMSIVVRGATSAYTIPSSRSAIRVYYV